MEKIKIGKIVNAVGLKGEVKVYSYAGENDRFEKLDRIIAGSSQSGSSQSGSSQSGSSQSGSGQEGGAKRAACKKPQSCLLYTSPSPRDRQKSRMPSSA